MEKPLEEYSLVTDPARLGSVAEALRGAGCIGLDTETTALNPREGRMRLLQLSDGGRTFVVDLFKVDDLSPLRGLLEEGPTKIGHNLKFDHAFLRAEHGIGISPLFDTMLADQILSGGEQEGSYALEAVVFRHLGQALDKAPRSEGWAGALSEDQLEYAARDAAVLPPLYERLLALLEEEKLGTVSRIEFEAIPAVAEMELAGVRLDTERWKHLEGEVRARRDRAAGELESHFPAPEGMLPLEGMGPNINLNSPQQVMDAFRSIGIDLPDTREWTLLKVDHPAARSLLEYRELQKKLGTYLETYAGYIHPGTGRIHPNFLQTRVPTGRLACTEPNIQQIPHEDEFRRCFVADEGNTLVIADYSQIELRILAEVSGDPGFVEAFQKGEDLHSVTAATMFGVGKDEVTKEQRSAAKRINFGLAYGRGAWSLSAQLGTDDERARRLIDEYFANYPGVQGYLRETADGAMKSGRLRTLSGRLRKFSVAGLDRERKAELRRVAMNFPIQGSSADIAKVAMIYIHRDLEDLDARLINCVHDELVVECGEELAEKVSERVRSAMLRAGEVLLDHVPLEVEVTTSREWSK